ncbi:serine hydrolase domain-containing protein [Ammonicoccus fulvus]|uniref:Serine hydrolase domain-containing protein n=1 Tax=Ammonicoccus fulvus TaxID=3138240 RepID=A0ABZ3FQ69_9ACTN
MRIVRLLCWLLMAGVLLGASSAGATPPSDGEWEDYVATVRRDLDLPGLGVRVTAGNGGWEDVRGRTEEGAPFAADSPVLVGSVSKSFTATLVLRLVEQGRFGLDDEVATRLAWFPHRRVTVRDLLRHTSGYDQSVGLVLADRFDTAPGALRRAAGEAAEHAPNGPLGVYAYSDANYLLLGALVEEVTGRPFAEALATEVLDPLALGRTGAEAALDPGPGHRSWWGTWVPFDSGYDDSGAPYGYVVSTLDDLDRWAAAHQDGGALPLAEAERLAMQSPQADAGRVSDGSALWYGYGWRGGTLAGGAVVEHTGATPGYFTHVLWLPERDVRVVVVANAYAQAADARLASVARDLARMAVGKTPAPVLGGDPLLGWGPFALLVLAVSGLVVGVVRVRRPGRSWHAAVCVLIGVLALVAPSMVIGLPGRTIRLWAPDFGWALIAVAFAWIGAAAVGLVSGRGRAAELSGREVRKP